MLKRSAATAAVLSAALVATPVLAQQDSVELAKIAFGAEAVDPLTGKLRTLLISLINVNSPMVYDATMLGALKVYARANQATIITPFILAGAMSPVTVAGTCAQTLAEALAGMAFVQLCNPGAPVVLGSFASSILPANARTVRMRKRSSRYSMIRISSSPAVT
jgi:trimethylamine:corrinoid methyltransferase-like protein